MPIYSATRQCNNPNICGPLTNVTIPCYTVLVVLVYDDIAILVSGAYMLVLLHWRVFLDVGIVTLMSGPYMLGLLHW
jgi:hypothetical protein